MRHSTIIFLCCLLRADEPPVIKNSGSPMRVEFACTEEDMSFAGLTCTAEEPCPIYLELSSVVPNGKKIAASGDLHSASGTIYSVLLMSDDSGATWKEPAKRVKGASLDQLQFFDLQSGWAAGEVLNPLPRDPFFLLTTDGGETWRQRSVTDEGGPGTIQRFWFDSAQHGFLTVDRGTANGKDRYSQYESETGGESWNIKGTTDQLPVIRRAPKSLEHPDWRLRTSKDGKSYQIEKRDGENWTSVASFLVHVADCKPKVDELKEPAVTDTDQKDQKDYVEELKLPGTDPKKTDTKKAKKKEKPGA